jgi:hypothetical protein
VVIAEGFESKIDGSDGGSALIAVAEGNGGRGGTLNGDMVAFIAEDTSKDESDQVID